MVKKNVRMEPKIESFKLSQLKEAPYNPRTITDEAMEGLTNSIKKFGCVEPIVVNTRGGKKTIIGGHQRYKALKKLHGPNYKCTCVTVWLSPSEEKLLNLSLNSPLLQGQFIAELAGYIDTLKKQIGKQDYIDLRLKELRADFDCAEKAGLVPDDEVPKPPRKTITKPGDLWQLGKHRLLCGDSTNPKDVSRLFHGQKASLFATDPPYCVDYTGDDRPIGGKDWSDVFREIDIKDPKSFTKAFYIVGLKFIKPKTALYIWHAASRRSMLDEVCEELGILVHQQIIWVKPWCLLMWVKGKMPPFKPHNKKVGTIWPVGYMKNGDPTTPEYYTDVWELDWEGKKRNSGLEHPTVKPIEVFAIPMRIHTSPGDICYEPALLELQMRRDPEYVINLRLAQSRAAKKRHKLNRRTRKYYKSRPAAWECPSCGFDCQGELPEQCPKCGGLSFVKLKQRIAV